MSSFTLSLIKKYGDTVAPEILSQYRQADRYLWVNENDRDLSPIRIDLPEPPEYNQIEGFGKPAREQKWTPPELPKRLIGLQTKCDTIDEIWEVLEKDREIYWREINFIRWQWYWRLNGKWVMINGKPTHIDGWHFFYCGWWHIDVGRPEYRDRDRKFFKFARFIYTETRRFKDIDRETKKAIPNDKGYYDFIETFKRLFLGFLYPKHRREGATYKAECINYEITSRTLNAMSGMQSLNDDQAKECFLIHLVEPWKKLPFFFKPNYEGSTSPKSELSFSPPAKRLSSKGSLSTSELGLQSKINFGISEASAYDSRKLYFHHDDEIAKLEKVNCIKRHQVVSQCLQQGSGRNIIGFTIKTSTVGEFDKGGGRNFKSLCEMSDYFIRNDNGRTPSGLAVLFIPAYEGLEGFIDEFGNSVIDDPTPEQAEYIGSNIGAKQYILNERKGLLDAGKFEELNEFIRLFPIKFTECFRTSSKSSGFNMQKVETYIDNLRFKPKSELPQRGDFEWVNKIKDTRVEFIPNENGKFLVSVQLNENESNRKWWSDTTESWQPGNTRWGVAGGDPYMFSKMDGRRLSNGGGGVVRKGVMKDGDFSMKRKICCTYEHRIFDKNVYGEDMLKMCHYYGVKMNPEINFPFLWDYFHSRGYDDYLLYNIDPNTMKMKNEPGNRSDEKIKQRIFSEYMYYIEHEADEDNHLEILEDCRDIAGMEEMTLYDRFTAVGYAFLGTAEVYNEIQELNVDEYDISKFVRKRVYSK